MSQQTIQSLIVALLGAGGATFLWTVVKAYLAVRDSAEGREDKAVNRLERYEADCRQQLQVERQWSAYWQRVSGIYLYALHTHGIAEPPIPPEPRVEP